MDRLHAQLSRFEDAFPGFLTEIVEGSVVATPVTPHHGRTIQQLWATAEGQLRMSLSNPYPGGGRHSAGNKMALTNIRERLQLHFDAEATMRSEVKDGMYRVTIRMPYISAPA